MEDGDIFCAARVALDHCPTVPPSVHVHVHGGIVTLTGSVRFPSERADAEKAIRRVPGVRHLENRIAVFQIPSAEGFEAPPTSG
jgi:osmotically-inducible protein OsmY